MATSAETRVVNAAGVVQGIALVTFPAASTILTDPADYDLSSSQYGALFLPQVVTAIVAALLGASLGKRFGTKRVYLAGLCAGLVSMTLLLASAAVAGDSGAYPLLLLATATLGAGFGLTVPALNTLTADFHLCGGARNPGVIERNDRVLGPSGRRVHAQPGPGHIRDHLSDPKLERVRGTSTDRLAGSQHRDEDAIDLGSGGSDNIRGGAATESTNEP